MSNFIEKFRLNGEKEDFHKVIDDVDMGVVFKGTNLWVLVFAIFIASLGLNVNSTAVVIGAMLVSPLMGPIIGLGMGMAINDLALLRKALYNYAFAVGVGLATSTVFFSLSPLNEASSEILSRTSPNIYDVLIAFFGGFAGILAVSSRQKGNVIPGVAIATALMPPLCTAGYGLANWNFAIFSGALYLFLINTVFIALATLLTGRFLNFPRKHLDDPKDEVIARRIVWLVVLITLLPSIYFGYDIVRQNQFSKKANQFVDREAVFPNDYLLKKNIDPKLQSITLTYGGEFIPEESITALKAKLPVYGLGETSLEIKQGFAYLKNSGDDEQTKQLTDALNEREKVLRELKDKVDEAEAQKLLGKQIFEELKAQYPVIESCVIDRALNNSTESQNPVWIAVVRSKSVLASVDQNRIIDFLRARVNSSDTFVYFEAAPTLRTPEPSPTAP